MPDGASQPAGASGARSLSVLLPPLLAGALLRLWNLPAQVLGGDELHAVRAALGSGLREILTTYRASDNCIPLTALYRLALEQGVVLTEMRLRAPILLCGLAAIVLIPAVLAPRLGRAGTAVLAWLVALSPVLALYSRIVRSYAPIVLLGFVAAMAFDAWWRTGRPRQALLYLLAAALAAWFHLGAAPIVAAPVLFALTDLALGRRLGLADRRGPRLGGLLLVAAGLAALFAAFLVPARASLAALLAEKRIERAIPGRAVASVLELQAGTAVPLLAVLFWIAALAGLVLLVRDDRRFGLYTLALVAGQVAGILVLSPLGLGYPVILNRYLIPALPWVLLWVARALGGALEGRAGGLPALRGVGAAAFVLALALGGPFADPAYRTNSFVHHDDFLAFYASRHRLPDVAVPPFYRELARRRESGAVIEHLWPTAWTAHVPFAAQEVHGREVLLSTVEPALADPRLRLATLVSARPEAFLASPARYLVVQLQPGALEDRIERPGAPRAKRMRTEERRYLRRAGRTMARRLAHRWGPPDYADAWLHAWDLARIRSRAVR